MDTELMARLESAARAVRSELGPTPNSEELQRRLFEHGVHGADAVLVTMQVRGVSFDEASAAYFASPVRAADREFQNAFIGALVSSHLTVPIPAI